MFICCSCNTSYHTIPGYVRFDEGFKDMTSFLNNQNNSPDSQLDSSKVIPTALEWMKEMKEMKERKEQLNQKLDFLGGFVVAFRGGLHSDIQVKPGNGLPIPAHRAVLATRSEIFKNMLESDGCKAAPSETISLPELDHDELESLLEFLYAGNLTAKKVEKHVFGNLTAKKVEKHVYSLSLAADKYEIPYLQKFCEHRMLESLDSSTALDVLEISDVCSNKILKETAMSFVLKNMDEIVSSTRFDEFVRKNPHLSVQITRALIRENYSKEMGNVSQLSVYISG